MTDTLSTAAQAPKTVAQMLGEIVWLMSQSPIHKQLFIGDLEWFAMPPVLLEQFRIFYGPNSPAAVALWAMVSEETEQRLEAGAHKLRPDEWKGGDRPWLIELVAPFGAQDEILADLSVSVFGGQPFKFHTATEDGRRVVKTYETPEPTLN
ncbi:toxin-activating lysine-acyltransferase [Brevundimonas faecalis]|uniref:toxin-activating lysine-acyltransferase n=1 Tax=Brevundimonas faecalis TaxID=947378 RepID=UPI0036201B11